MKVGKIDEGTVVNIALIGGVAYLAYTFIKPISDFFGLTQSSGQAAYNNATQAAVSPWSPTYFNTAVPKGTTVTIFTSASANAIAKAINNTYDDFNIQWGSDTSGLKAAFNKITSKIKVSQVAAAYAAMYNTDLLTRHKRKFFGW